MSALTGRTRFRIERRGFWFFKQEFLVLEVEENHVNNSTSVYDPAFIPQGNTYTDWRDATMADITTTRDEDA